MTTRITQIEDDRSKAVKLKLEGSMNSADAELLQKICNDLQTDLGAPIRIDLTGVSFLDSLSASVLSRLKATPGIELEGAHLFVQQSIEFASENEV